MTLFPTKRRRFLALLGLLLCTVALLIWWRFVTDMAAARLRVSLGSGAIKTPCGTIEFQKAGTGASLLAIHGSGGGFDQGMALSARAAGLRSDTAASKTMKPAALERVQAPTLVISARDDGYGTYASAEDTANQIAGARFIGFERGWHTWVGHDDEVMAAIIDLVIRAVAQPQAEVGK